MSIQTNQKCPLRKRSKKNQNKKISPKGFLKSVSANHPAPYIRGVNENLAKRPKSHLSLRHSS